MHSYVHSSIIYNIQDLETAQVPICRWVDKKICLHNGIVCSSKKEETLTYATAWIDLEIIILGEISQSVKNKYHFILHSCGI